MYTRQMRMLCHELHIYILFQQNVDVYKLNVYSFDNTLTVLMHFKRLNY